MADTSVLENHEKEKEKQRDDLESMDDMVRKRQRSTMKNHWRVLEKGPTVVGRPLALDPRSFFKLLVQ